MGNLPRVSATLILLTVLAAGCGSSGASSPTASPTRAPTAPPRYTDRASGITVAVAHVVPHRGYALLSVSERNGGSTDYQSPSNIPFRDTSFGDPTSGSSAAACDADASLGPSLNYLTVSAHTTQRGWIRCDFPNSTRVIVLIWNNHIVGTFHL
jgi:hypothetical protein